MGMKQEKHNIRVEVYSQGDNVFGSCAVGPDSRTAEEEIADCQEIVSQIRRHVSGYASPRVVWDTEKLCEFCGSYWVEGDDSPHNGGCCDEDMKNVPESCLDV